MKNSLIKYLDYEHNDHCDFQSHCPDTNDISDSPPNCRQNVHMLVVTDDMGIVDDQINSLKSRGVRIV